MITRTEGLRRRLLVGFVGVGVVTALVTAAATITSFLVLANEHPIGANRVGRRIVAAFPGPLSTRAVGVALVVTGVFLIAVAVVTALSIADRVLRPVGKLAAAADRMAAGDLRARVVPHGRDEIADVARSFNQMADSLTESVSTLQHMEATARRFAGDVSHELRTPLAAMVAVTDVLAGQTAGMTPEAARAADLVLREIRHLDRLVHDLIEISRFDTGTAVLDAELVDVSAAIATSLQVRGWGESVTVEADPGLRAHVDLRRFDVILANLVGNAVKYGKPPIVLRAHRSPEGLVVEVSDGGPGIAPDAVPFIFERFYKADAARARSDGSGLGLAIALENARLHGGEIRASNGSSGGAVFQLTLPGVADAPRPR